MAREHARIHCSVWRPGDDFRQRSGGAQRLYFVVLSQPQLNNAGVIPLMISKWSRCASDTTVEDIETHLAELVEHRYFIVDRDTDELLVRTFIRGDGIAKQPNMLKSALRLAEQIESQVLRDALARELLRLEHPGARATALAIAPDVAIATVEKHLRAEAAAAEPDPPANPSPKGSANPSRNPSANPRADPRSRGSSTSEGNPSLRPAGWGGGGGRGSSSRSGGTPVGGSRADAREADPPPPEPNLDPNNPRCADHRDIPPTERGPGCHACRAVREQVEAFAADAVVDARTTGQQQRVERRAAIDACPDCDEQGMRDLDDRLARCTHPNLERTPSP